MATFYVRPAGDRPDYRVVISFLWQDEQNVDTDGDSARTRSNADGFYFLSYQKVPGWRAHLYKEKLDTPVDLGGFSVSEQYTRVVWRARKPRRDRIVAGYGPLTLHAAER